MLRSNIIDGCSVMCEYKLCMLVLCLNIIDVWSCYLSIESMFVHVMNEHIWLSLVLCMIRTDVYLCYVWTDLMLTCIIMIRFDVCSCYVWFDLMFTSDMHD